MSDATPDGWPHLHPFLTRHGFKQGSRIPTEDVLDALIGDLDDLRARLDRLDGER
jgi:hypothetical protein